MHLSKAVSGCLLYSCLWIAVSFASLSSKESEKKSKGRFIRLSNEKIIEWSSQLEPLGTTPNLIFDGKMHRTATRQEGIDAPCRKMWFLADVAPVMLKELKLSETLKKLGGSMNLVDFGVYPETYLFMLQDGHVVLNTHDRKKVRVLSEVAMKGSEKSWSDIAPTMSDNGLVWVHHQSNAMLVNLDLFNSADDSAPPCFKIQRERIISVSLNESGDWLAVCSVVKPEEDEGYGGMVHVYNVNVDPNGRIWLTRCLPLFLEEDDAFSVMFLSRDVLAVERTPKDPRCDFYVLNREKMRADLLKTPAFKTTNIIRMSYYPAYDLVVAFRKYGGEEDEQKFVEVKKFAMTTMIAIISPYQIELLYDDKITRSHNVNFMLARNNLSTYGVFECLWEGTVVVFGTEEALKLAGWQSQ